MQHWIDRTGIARRPVPKLGLSKEERAEIDGEALAWGLNTGAVAPIVRSFVNARAKGDEELTSFNVACDVARMLGRPGGLMENTVRVLLQWARENRPEWFEAIRPKAPIPSRNEQRPKPVPQDRPAEPPSLTPYRPRF